MKKEDLKVPIIIGVMCVVLSAGIVTQINTVRNSITSVGKTQTENELRDSVLRWKQKYENAYAKLETKEKELDKIRDEVASIDSSYSVLNSKLIRYNNLLGKTELKGKGVIITLEDGDSTAPGYVTDKIVHDNDLLQVVNALKNADADAISINNQRIITTTSISCVGNVVKINSEKVGSPFVIRAIGSPNQLTTALKMPGGYLELLERDGVKVKVESFDKESVIIPKYDGGYNFDYARIYE